ncbi:MAG: hypothetical protein NZ551_02445 [Microscillaceae bacterium]|nr:hypothetical protein [Microscillaceae bacterium]MDW8460045.1 hypothetical protein [Cytophagales bacterium]
MKKRTYYYLGLLASTLLLINTACQRDPNQFILKGSESMFVAFKDSLLKVKESLDGKNEANNLVKIPVERTAMFDKDLVVEFQIEAKFVKSNAPAGNRYQLQTNAGEGRLLIPAGSAKGEIALTIVNDTDFIDDQVQITITLTGTSQKEFTLGYPSKKRTPSTRDAIVINVEEDDCPLVISQFSGTYDNIVLNDMPFLWIAGVELRFVSNITLSTQPNTILDDNMFGIQNRAAAGGLGPIYIPTAIQLDPVTKTTNVPRQNLYATSGGALRSVETGDRPRGGISTCTAGFVVNCYVRRNADNSVGTTFTATYVKQ